MCYFDEVTFTTNVMRKKVFVDISDFSVFSYRACAIASEVTDIGKFSITIRFPNLELCYLPNFKSFGAQARTLWEYI